MADFLLGSQPLIRGNLDLCRIGAATAEVFLATTSSSPSRGDTLTLSMRGTSRLMTVVDVGGDYLQIKCRLVAGRGHLDEPLLEPRDYRGYGAAEIAQDAIGDAGEVAGDWSLLDVYCANWTRSQMPLRQCLGRISRLVQDPLVTWRVQDDGAIALVKDDFSVVTETETDFAQLGAWGQERLLLLGMTDTRVVPGRSVSAFGQIRNVDRCLYEFTSDTFTSWVWYL